MKKIKTKVLSLLLVACMVLGMLPISAFAADPVAIAVSTLADLKIKIAASTGTATSPTLINLTADIDLTSALVLGNPGDPTKTKHIKLTGKTITRTVNPNVSITLWGGSSLTLENIVVQDSNTLVVVETELFSINSSTLNINAGTKITQVHAEGRAGAIQVSGGGTVNMTGGEITDNSATPVTDKNFSGAGIAVIGDNSVFNMSGGTISNNSASYGYGGGVLAENGGKFKMSGGTITENIAKYGAGVCVASGGTFEMSGTAQITNQTNSNATSGGAVYLTTKGTTDPASTTITPPVFKMTGGTISGNSVTADGGGIAVDSAATAATITISGGTITTNKCRTSNNPLGGGLHITSNTTLNLSGNPMITGNTMQQNGKSVPSDIHLDAGAKISLTGALTGDAGKLACC